MRDLEKISVRHQRVPQVLTELIHQSNHNSRKAVVDSGTVEVEIECN